MFRDVKEVKEVIDEDVLGPLTSVYAKIRYDTYTAYPFEEVIAKLEELQAKSLVPLYIRIYSDYETMTIRNSKARVWRVKCVRNDY